MVIHPILGIITMGILDPIDGCMTIPFYEKPNYVLTTAHTYIYIYYIYNYIIYIYIHIIVNVQYEAKIERPRLSK